MVNYIPRFNFVYKLQCFQGFSRRKKNVQRVLVLNLVEISQDLLIFISIYLKTTEPRFDSEPVCTTRAHEHFKFYIWAHLLHSYEYLVNQSNYQ